MAEKMKETTKDQAPNKMTLLPVRLPEHFVARIKSEAKEDNVSASDVLRKYIQFDGERVQKTDGKKSPRRREVKELGEISGVDPKLLAELSAIGRNINQIARCLSDVNLINQLSDAHVAVGALEVMVELQKIRVELSRIADAHQVS